MRVSHGSWGSGGTFHLLVGNERRFLSCLVRGRVVMGSGV